MRHLLVALLILGATIARAYRLEPCANTGESRFRRTITPEYGTTLSAAELPAHWRELATRAWQADNASNATATVTAARVFTLPHATFYLITVNKEQALFSTKCPHERCGEAYWWDNSTRIVVDRKRPPAGVPGDEFFLLNADKYPAQHAALFHADPFTEGYDLQEDCLVHLTLEGAAK